VTGTAALAFAGATGAALGGGLALLFLIWRNRGIRHRLEAGLEQCRRTIRARNELLATLAHEIRTPLTIVRSGAEVLLEETPGPLTDRQRRFLDSIRANTLRLIQFSENMLASIKVDQGWEPDRSTPLDLRRLSRQVAELMQPLLVQRGQTIRFSFPSLLSRPRADEAWIRQVLVNLVHNAAKHTAEGGMIVISATEQEDAVVITVSDNGTGLVGATREQLFREFYQEQPHSGAGQDGAGLGLAIVRSVVERHGGTVYAGTAPGAGTMVSFTLPVEQHP
jgi:two-component system, OmpR family, phosphate regulon sensor histidine kinase PhoR